MVTRRSFVASSAAVIAALPAVPRGASAQQNTLVVYTGLHEHINSALFKLAKQEAGLDVSPVAGGTGDLIPRLRAEAARPQADFLLAIGIDALEANVALLEPYRSIHHDAVAPSLMSSPAWYPVGVLPQVFMVNTRLVPTTDIPRLWPDLADSRWKGKIAYAGADSSGAAFVMLASILHWYGEDEGWKLFGRMLDNFVITNSSGRLARGTADGEYAIGLQIEDVALEYKNGGAPLEIVYPGPQTVALPNGVAIVKNGPNAENARRFLDFALSKPAQEFFTTKIGRRSVRTDVAPPSGLPPLSEISIRNYPVEWGSANRARIMRRYLELVRR